MDITPEVITDRQRPRDIRVSPDGRHAVYILRPQCRKQKESVSSLWMAETDKPNSSRQITSATFHDIAPEFSPDGRYISFISDRAHAGITSAIYLLPTQEHGESLPLTSTEKRKPIGMYQWSPDGKYIAFTSADEETEEARERRERGDDAVVWGEDWGHARLRLFNVETKVTTVLVAPGAHVESLVWSPNGKEIAYTLLTSCKEEHMLDGGDICIVNIQNRATRKVHHYTTWIRDLNWLENDLVWIGVQDGESVWSSDAVWRWSSSTGHATRVAYGETNCAWGIRRCGDQLVVHVQEGLNDILEAFPSPGRRIFQAPSDIEAGWDISREGRLAICMGTPAGDEVISVVNGSKLQLASHSNVLPSAIAYKTVYLMITTQLDGIIYIPENGPKPYPAVVIPHGGPYWRVTDGTDPTMFSWTPWLLSLGYAVLLPNYRGGSGHGARWSEAVKGDPSVSYQDVIDLIEHCIVEHEIDRERVVSAGWSNGGYLTYLALTRDSTFHFAAGIAGAGTSCWDTKVLTSDVPTFQGALTGVLSWKTLMYAGTAGANSPIKHLDDFKSPLLILHGEEDVRVPVSQSRSMHLALRCRGHAPEMVIYPREGHANWERQHAIHMLWTIEAFLRKHVPPIVQKSSGS